MMIITSSFFAHLNQVVIRICHGTQYIDVKLAEEEASAFLSGLDEAVTIMKAYRVAEEKDAGNLLQLSSHPRYNSRHDKNTSDQEPPRDPSAS